MCNNCNNHLNTQDRAYLLLSGQNNRHYSYNLPQSCGCGQNQGTSSTILQVPVIYTPTTSGTQYDMGCGGYTQNNTVFIINNTECQHDKRKYEVDLLCEGIKDAGAAIGEIIRAVRAPKNTEVTEGSDKAKPQTEEQSEIEKLKAQIEDLRKELEAQKAANGKPQVPETVKEPDVSAPPIASTDADKTAEAPKAAESVSSTANTSSASGTSSASTVSRPSEREINQFNKDCDEKSLKSINEKTGKICDELKEAIVEGDVDKANDIAKGLSVILTDTSKSYSNITSFLNKSGIADDEKKLGEKAIDMLDKIQDQIFEVLSMDIEEKPKTSQVDNSQQDSEVKGIIENASANKPGTVDLDALRKIAKDNNALYQKNLSLEQQKETIQAYNNWAEAMADPKNNATTLQLDDCISSMKYLCDNNDRTEVRSLVAKSKELRDELTARRKEIILQKATEESGKSVEEIQQGNDFDFLRS